jgi:hypothetical protein
VCLSAAKAKKTPGVDCRGGYLRLRIGYNSCGKAVDIHAHTFVLWAARGLPPGYTYPRWVCMHLCHNKSCINPTHLVWGYVEDNVGMSREHRRKRHKKVTTPNVDGMPISREKY